MWIWKQPQCPHTKPYTYATNENLTSAIAPNPSIDLQWLGTYSKSDIQYHIRTQQFQELLTKMVSMQRQSINQYVRKLAETAGQSDIPAQGYSGYFL